MKRSYFAFNAHGGVTILVSILGCARIALGADTTPPTVPTSFSAVVGACARADLNWAPATDPKGPQSGLAGYRVYRNSTPIADLGLVTTFSDPNLVSTASYTYNVSALDISGNESPLSSAASVSPCPDVTAPSVPSSLSPTAVSPNQVDLVLGTATDGSGLKYETVSGLKGFQIFRDGTSANNKLADLPVSATSYSDTSLSANQTAYYAVRAIDNNNNVSGFRISVSVTTPFGPPGAPTGLSANTPNCHSVHLDWSAPSSVGSGIAYYQVYRDGAALQQTSGTGLNDNSASPGASYIYAVTATDTGGRTSTAQSLPVTVPPCAAAAASNVKLEFDNDRGQAKLHWNGTPGALYQVQYSPGFFGPWKPVDAPTADFAITNITDGQPSSIYRVALFTNTPAYLANFFTNILDTSAPPTPANLSLNAVSDTEVSLTWDSVTDAGTTDQSGHSYTSGLDRYLIYRDGVFLKNEPASATSSSDTSVQADVTYTYTLASIDKSGNRSGFIGGTVQARKQCTYTLSYSTATFGTGGGSSNATMTAGQNCAWTASPGSSWLHSSSSGNGNGTLSYTVDANGTTSPRQGTISAGGKTLTITQNGVVCSYSLAPSSANYGSGASSGSFSVTTPSGCSWTASTSSGWLHTSSSGNGNGTVSYTVDSNGGTSSRSGSITAGGQTFSITQSGISCTYGLNPVSNNLGSGGGSGSFTVSSQAGCAWSASTGSAWIHTFSSGNGNGTATYTVDANGSTSPRSGQILAGGQIFTVSQDGIGCTYSLTPAGYNHGSGAENGSFSVSAPGGCSWSASPGVAWIHTTSSGNGNGTVGYSVDANGGTSSRSGQVSVGGQLFNVTQAGQVGSLGDALDNTTLNWTTGGAGAWTAENAVYFSGGDAAQSGAIGNNQSSWLETSINGPVTLSFYWKVSSEGGYDFLRFYLDGVEQSGVAGISGEVNWQQRTVTVGPGSHVAHWEYSKDPLCCAGGSDAGWVDQVQLTAPTCAYSISPGGASMGASAGGSSFSVNTVAGCGWTASSFDGWVHTSSTGSGNGTVNYTFDSNSGTTSRSGSITVGGQTFSITQAGVGCSYYLGAPSASHSSAASSGSFTVNAGAGCNWSASTASGWIHTSSSGSGNGTVTYTVDADAGSSPRSGTISVAGQSFQVNQSGDVAPVANAGADLSVSIGASASFNGNGSSDADGSIVSYSWDFGDGTTGSGQSVTHVYGSLGIYTVRLTVTDNLGATGTDTALATIVALADVIAPTATLTSPANGATVSSTITLAATASDNVGGSGVARVEFYSDAGNLVGTATASPYSAPLDTTILGNGSHSLYCKAYDAAGNSGNSTSISVSVANAVASGSCVWSTNFGGTMWGSDSAVPSIVREDKGGNVFVAGSIMGTSSFGGSVSLTSAGSQDILIAKYSVSGALQWAKRFGSTGNDYASGAALDSGTNLVIVGAFAGTVDFGNGATLTSAEPQSIFVAKYNSAGTLQWVKQFAGAEVCQAVAVDSADNILITGGYGYYGSTVNFGGSPLPLGGGAGQYDVFVAKLNSSGNHVWSRGFGGMGYNVGYSISVATNGDVVVGGSFQNSANFGGQTFTSAGGSDVFVAKYSAANGNHVWSKRFGGVSDDYANGMAVDQSGNIAVTGYFQGTVDLGAGPITSSSSYSVYLVVYSSTGAYSWSRTIMPIYGGGGSSVTFDSAGSVILAGSATGLADYGNGWYVGGGTANAFIAKYSNTGAYLWANVYGGSGNSSTSVSIGAGSRVLATGSFGSSVNFGCGQLTSQGGLDGFVVRFAP